MSVPLLSESIQYLKGVGPKRADVLAAEGIRTAADLLALYPRRYLDRTNVVRIADIQAPHPAATVVGTITRTRFHARRGRGSRFELTVSDGSGGFLTCVWFQRARAIANLFKEGERVAFHGKITLFSGRWSMSHPEFDRVDDAGPKLDTGRIIGLYPGHASFDAAGLSSRLFRRILFTWFKEKGAGLEDPLPPELAAEFHLMDGRSARRAIHFPKSREELDAATRRLKFEELFFFQLMMGAIRTRVQRDPGPPLTADGPLLTRFMEQLLFTLTPGQHAALQDIRVDTSHGVRMNRLLQGDVGSGKTVVAVAAVLMAIDSGCQAAFLAPTEILAEQHFRTLSAWLEPLGLYVGLLTGSTPAPVRRSTLEGIAQGSIAVAVGTHAVIQEGVAFERLGLCIVDEQHRFGVMQRAALYSKGDRPHILLMSATPIPRSLALTVYGDLDVTVIRDRPPGRQEVETRLLWEKRRSELHDLMRREIAAGRQVYMVYPLVEESEVEELKDIKDAESGYQEVTAAFPEVHVELVHGRMKGADKDAAMQRFVRGEAAILVSTTVIEVGVDVPNASVMVIEHAERFGLSQLHQLRGRIGRGRHTATCVLMCDFKRSEASKTRLKAMVETNDGFRISEVDLKLRGAGDFFGTRQSGLPAFKLADIAEDTDLVAATRTAARTLLTADPGLSRPENRVLRDYFHAFVAPEGLSMSRIG